MKQKILISLIILITAFSIFFIVVANAQTESQGSSFQEKSNHLQTTTGGDCSYCGYTGECQIISIVKTEASRAQLPNAFYEGYEVKFKFDLTQTGYDEGCPRVPDYILNQEHLLRLTNSWYPGPAYLDKYNIEQGNVFGCNFKIIKQGTCSPFSFEFDNINLTDYFETGLNMPGCGNGICDGQENYQACPQDCTQFFPDCLELIAGHNEKDAPDRVNVVFMGFDYDNIQEFKQRAITVVNINGDGSVNDTGLLAEPPFRNYQDKFNLWYINEVRDYNANSFTDDIEYLLAKYPSFINMQQIRMIKDTGRSYASLSGDYDDYTGYMSVYDWLSMGELRNVVLHEFGHSFGNLCDEYSYHYISNPLFPPACPNCDIGNAVSACQKWCNCSPISIEDLKAIDCSGMEMDYCHLHEPNVCQWIYEEHPVFGQSGCVNKISLCTQIENESECKNSKGDDDWWSRNWCEWSTDINPYFKAHCIPGATNVNVCSGADCLDEALCIPSCTASDWFRSSENSKMRNVSQPWNYVSKKHLIEKLNSLGSTHSGITAVESAKNILMFDEFDRQGNIINGGLIDLDAISQTTQNKLVAGIKVRTKVDPLFTSAGNIALDSVNPTVLIDEYLKLLEREPQAELIERTGESARVETMDGNKDILIQKVSPDKSLIKSGAVSAVSSQELKIEKNKLFMETSAGKSEINILPDQAILKAKERSRVTEINEIELKEEARPVYSVKGIKKTKLFSLIPITMNVETKVSAETGDVISVKNPWWSFFAW